MISFSHNESFTVTQEGRAIALYLADQWHQQGKHVTVTETDKAITVSYTVLNTLTTMDEFLTIGQNITNNMKGNE